MVQLKFSQLIVAGGIAAASLVGFGGIADAAPTAGTAAVACVNGDSVIGLSDDPLVVPVQFNGSDESVSTRITCDVPTCAEGALSVVTDDSGVQHQACVASAAAVSPATAAKATYVPPAEAAPTASPAELPKTGTGSGGLVIAALLVGSGSVASFVSRRRR